MTARVQLTGGPCAGRWVRGPVSYGWAGLQTELWVYEGAPGVLPARRWFQYVYDDAGAVWRPTGRVGTAVPDAQWHGSSSTPGPSTGGGG